LEKKSYLKWVPARDGDVSLDVPHTVRLVGEPACEAMGLSWRALALDAPDELNEVWVVPTQVGLLYRRELDVTPPALVLELAATLGGVHKMSTKNS